MAAWPIAARAQQPAMPVVGFLHPESLEAFAENLRGFRQGLKETGYVEGENVAFEFRWADGQLGRLPELAADLVRRRVAVIATASAPAAFAAREASATIPIVFGMAQDPVKLGLDRRARNRAVGTEHATIAWLRPQRREARHKFADRWNVRQYLDAFGCRHSQGSQLTCLDIADR